MALCEKKGKIYLFMLVIAHMSNIVMFLLKRSGLYFYDKK